MKFIVSERFNQDLLESKGGNENPTVPQFNQNESSLQILGSQALAPVTGNTGKRGCCILEVIDDKSLPKRQRKRKWRSTPCSLCQCTNRDTV